MTPQPNEPTAEAIRKAAILIIRTELRNEGEGTHEEMQEAYDENEWYLNESKRVQSIIESWVAAPLRDENKFLRLERDDLQQRLVPVLRAENERLKAELEGTMQAGGYDYFVGQQNDAEKRSTIAYYVAKQLDKQITQLRVSLSTAERKIAEYHESKLRVIAAKDDLFFEVKELKQRLSTAVDALEAISSGRDWATSVRLCNIADTSLAQLRPLLAGQLPISDDGNGVVRKPPLTSQDYSKKASTNSGAMEPDAANVANSQYDPAAHCITRPSSDYSAQTPAAEGKAKWRCERCGKQFEVDSPLCYCRACEIAVRASAQAEKGNT